MEPKTKDLLLTVFCALGAGPWVGQLAYAIGQPTGDPPWARLIILGYFLGFVSPFSTAAAIAASVWHIRNDGRKKALKFFLLAISSIVSTVFMIQMAIGWYEYTSTG